MTWNGSRSVLYTISFCIKTRGFKMAFLNIVSLPKHVDELRISELFLHFDLLALNETRLDSSISDGLVKIRGYDIVRKDRSRTGGGVFASTSVVLLILKFEMIWFLTILKQFV